MTRSNTRSFKTNLIAAALGLTIVGTLAFTSMAHAQIVSQTTTAPPTTNPTLAPSGVTVGGWVQSLGAAQGYNLNGDGKGLVSTFTDGAFKLTTESFFAGNSQTGCTPDCASTQVKQGIIGEQLAGARSTNQGSGSLTAPVGSFSGINAKFDSSIWHTWSKTAAPTQP